MISARHFSAGIVPLISAKHGEEKEDRLNLSIVDETTEEEKSETDTESEVVENEETI